MRNNGIPISEVPIGALIMFGFIFTSSFLFFMLLGSNYIPVFFGEKIQSTVVGIDSIYHKPKNYYRYDYFAVFEYSKKNIALKKAVYSSSSKKEIIQQDIGKKSEVYYLKGYNIIDPEEMFLSNTLMIFLFFFWFIPALFFYSYFKEKLKNT
jgi:hypothetical protein